MNEAVIKFFETHLTPDEIKDKDVIEFGARYVNGTVRYAIEQYKPKSYYGVDMEAGPCVDIVSSLDKIFTIFPENSFDLVISCEMLEHVIDFNETVQIIKKICKPGGIIMISTRSLGFGYHAYPYDFWRYELEDMRLLFQDCEILTLEKDPQDPGVLLKAKKLSEEVADSSHLLLYNILANKRIPLDAPALQAWVEQRSHMQRKGPDLNYFTENKDLLEIGSRKNTDKAAHGYLQKYEFFLKKFKNDAFNLLELGIFKGSSLNMWHDYFPNATIYGCDLNLQCAKFRNDRINIIITNLGNSSSYRFLDKTYKLIIDDASHFWDHQILAFIMLFPKLEAGGIYIIEDLHTSFAPLKQQYANNSDLPASDFLLKLAEIVLAQNAPLEDEGEYQAVLKAFAREVDMISFIQKSCIIIKK